MPIFRKAVGAPAAHLLARPLANLAHLAPLGPLPAAMPFARLRPLSTSIGRRFLASPLGAAAGSLSPKSPPSPSWKPSAVAACLEPWAHLISWALWGGGFSVLITMAYTHNNNIMNEIGSLKEGLAANTVAIVRLEGEIKTQYELIRTVDEKLVDSKGRLAKLEEGMVDVRERVTRTEERLPPRLTEQVPAPAPPAHAL
ncbi:hypothetical protein DRE_06720 [Drechslerella stenobrocha 248]|uniref:Uncharacterized protein n=1 Tax=Drechslerella stenobrocha 248 TaxID=1043628 RepID=W7HXC0_9PEZI|nr:hypothetical protein DRE_06720 [Drechslerella stenobrocha 248]